MADDPWGNNAPPPPPAPAHPQGREWDLLEKVVMASVEEQRRARRWGIFFKLLTFAYLFGLFWLMFGESNVEKAAIAGEHTAMVEISGEIADDSLANADAIISGLQAAFEAPKSKAVLLRINSPGGSPVQSAYVYDEIRRLRGLHKDKKVYAVITDMGASGAYYIASAADQIYVNPGSLVGSIGVIMQGFGVEGLMQKLGVENRTLTAGEHKAILSPFSPMKPDEVAHVNRLLEEVHQQFINAVKQGRGQRLKADPQIFSGLFWTGQQAVELGLADGFGSVDSVARSVVQAEDVVDYSEQPDALSGLIRKLGTSMGDAVAARLAVPASPHMR
ncbi:MAG TPA: signal peptide peptidase SppA [Moraxellaceae bacterium]|nr:signal peptide peptidase SppA [Moraxellaceae bacterium]